MVGDSDGEGGVACDLPDTSEIDGSCDQDRQSNHDDSDSEEDEDDDDDTRSMVTMETSTTSAAMGSACVRKSDRKRWRKVQRLRERKEAVAAAEGNVPTSGDLEEKRERAAHLVQTRVREWGERKLV